MDLLSAIVTLFLTMDSLRNRLCLSVLKAVPPEWAQYRCSGAKSDLHRVIETESASASSAIERSGSTAPFPSRNQFNASFKRCPTRRRTSSILRMSAPEQRSGKGTLAL
jgi:hypothetical protein